jgi:hypothetical protein
VDGPVLYEPKIVPNYEDGSYDVSYEPTKSGDYKIKVNVDNKPVKGSPFNIFVKEGCDPNKTTAEGKFF